MKNNDDMINCGEINEYSKTFNVYWKSKDNSVWIGNEKLSPTFIGGYANNKTEALEVAVHLIKKFPF